MMPKNCNYIPQIKYGHPRAAIFSSKNIVIHEINELKNSDMAVGLATIEGRSVMIVSLYMDINHKVRSTT